MAITKAGGVLTALGHGGLAVGKGLGIGAAKLLGAGGKALWGLGKFTAKHPLLGLGLIGSVGSTLYGTGYRSLRDMDNSLNQPETYI